MTRLAWFPEVVPPWGAFTAQGLRGILGRPAGLHPLTILVRETAQNSSDAQISGKQVHFSVDGFELEPAQLKRLREGVFAELPPLGLNLSARLPEALAALVIRDTNTRGLGGPTRADKAEEGHDNRYIRFLLDIGVADRQKIEGGTYGFGRSIAYNISGVRTVLVYSRTRDQLKAPQSRFIASGLGEPYTHRGKRYTGRHWWGRTVRDTIEPLVGTSADALAAAIGLPRFGAEETGTAVMILDPVLRTPDPERAMAFIAESITWNLWPKMITDGRRRPMKFSVSWNGKSVPVPDPARTQPLPGFIRALEVLREGDGEHITADGVEVIEINAERLLRSVSTSADPPKKTLGRLALTRFPFRTRRPSTSLGEDEDPRISTAAPFTEHSRHVVLLRKPQLVVTYQEYAGLPDGDAEWAGVFLADDEHNTAFSKAEPPAHDCWEPATVEDRGQRQIVNIAMREIREAVNSRHRAPVVAPPPPVGGASVARLANALGPLFAGAPGGGSGVVLTEPRPNPPAPPGRRPQIRIVRSTPTAEDGQIRCEIEFTVRAAAGDDASEIRVAVDVATGDGSTVEGEDRPAGAAVPTLVAIHGPSPVAEVTGARETRFTVNEPGESTWVAVATAPDGVMVAFSLDAERPAAESAL